MFYTSWRFLVQQKAAKIAANVGELGKSGPLERAELANQIQGFRIPDR